MLDLFNIPTNASSTQTFYANGSTSWQTWEKPRGAKMIQILCVGSGAGGSSGPGGVGTQSGGRGGSCAGLSRVMIPASLLPDTLFVQVPVGGAGGIGISGGTIAGASGGISYVALAPSASSTVLIAASSATVAGPTTAPTVATATAFNSLGLFLAIAGVAGAAGATGAGASVTAFGSNILLTGGAAGGGKTTPAGFVGGSILNTAGGPLPYISGSTEAGTPSAGSGVYLLQPFCATGGAGGGGSTGSGFNGGDGAYGCGGGGGGGGRGNGGNGGKGGDGLVIITTIF